MRGLRRKANICGAVEDTVLKLSERQVLGKVPPALNNSTHGFQHNRLGVASPNARSFAAKETEKFHFTDTTAKGEDDKKSRRRSCPLLNSNQAIMSHWRECRGAAMQVCAARSRTLYKDLQARGIFRGNSVPELCEFNGSASNFHKFEPRAELNGVGVTSGRLSRQGIRHRGRSRKKEFEEQHMSPAGFEPSSTDFLGSRRNQWDSMRGSASKTARTELNFTSLGVDVTSARLLWQDPTPRKGKKKTLVGYSDHDYAVKDTCDAGSVQDMDVAADPLPYSDISASHTQYSCAIAADSRLEAAHSRPKIDGATKLYYTHQVYNRNAEFTEDMHVVLYARWLSF
ncbi:hypothetical protein B0H16DRAFT_1478677 [Mycena metata]|uniref:Uncharacterized protein n=1 Tax=Mycena metata TaxID=1033252 RepID=A0AAD7H687_9AGAR|nr:hypothetical protein B0H16DRAFT_1478677 [Mycena metata]